MARLLALALGLAVRSSAAPAEFCLAGDCDESGLLQRSKQQAVAIDSVLDQATPKPFQLGLAFQGGGWLSPADYSGLLAGLLHATKKPVDWLLKDVSSLSADSGGNWFIHGLSYSPRFLATMYEMAKSPMTAGMIYNMRFSGPEIFGRKPVTNSGGNYTFNATLPQCQEGQKMMVLLNKLLTGLSHVTGPLGHISVLSAVATAVFTFLEAFVSALRLPVPADLKKVFIALQFVLLQAWQADQGYFSWTKVIEFFYEQSYGIPKGATLGSKPNKWAEGVLLASSGSLVTSSAYAFPVGFDYGAVQLASPTQAITTTVDPGLPYGMAAPVLFSIRMGQEGQEAPLPVCSPLVCGMKFDYRYQTPMPNQSADEQWPIRRSRSAAKTVGEFYAKNVQDVIGSLPITGVASAVTAVMGVPFSLPPAAALSTACGFIAAPYVADAEPGALFTKGEQLWLKGASGAGNFSDVMDEFAADNLQQLMDGGSNDESGIAQALIAGSNEVVAFLEWNEGEASSCKPKGDAFLLGQFAPNDNATVADQCVNGTVGNYYNQAFMSFAGYQLFDLPNTVAYQYMYNQTAAFPGRVLAKPPREMKYLSHIMVGTLPELATVENPVWGIEGGRKVKMHFVAIVTKAEIDYGPGTTLFEYGTLAQEVLDTVICRKNKVLVEYILKFLHRDQA